jgi:hypothetical protein
MDAMVIAAAGSRNVAPTSKPGFATGLSEEKTTCKMAMQEPAPASAASDEAPITNFRRIGRFS